MLRQAQLPVELATVWITCATPSYSDLLSPMAQKFIDRGIMVQPMVYPDQGDWARNCLYRSRLLRQLGDQYPTRAVGLLDVDLDPVGQLDILLALGWDKDAQVEIRPGMKECHQWGAGIVAFAPTTHGRAALSRWADLCLTDPEPGNAWREQLYLGQAISGQACRISRIPQGWVLVPPRGWDQVVPPGVAVIHRPASRDRRLV